MKKAPKISIVTPSFNQGKYIEDAIQSIISQNYPNLEYIIIDGGSSDNSLSIIKKYSKKLSYWVSEPDGGQAEAINKGFGHTTGEIMTWLNSDDILMPGTLQLVANIFTRLSEVNWVSGIPTTINDEGFLTHIGLKPAYIRKFIRMGLHHGACLGYIMQEGTFWRRSLWEMSGGKLDNVPYSLDFRLWRNFARYSELVPIFTSLAAYRLNPDRKNKTNRPYYKEIGVKAPGLSKVLMTPFRLFVHIIFRKIRASSKIFFEQRSGLWIYRSGWAGNSIFSLKSLKIRNL